MKSYLVEPEKIEKGILLIRGEKVLLDSDLASMYGVEVKYLKRQVRRNLDRFPSDFMFELSRDESASLRCQNVTLKRGQHPKYLSYAFTEQGVAMLSSVLNSQRAVQVNIQIVRIFVRLRRYLATHKELASKLNELESVVGEHDGAIRQIFEAIRQLITKPVPRKKRIGFSSLRTADSPL